MRISYITNTLSYLRFFVASAVARRLGTTVNKFQGNDFAVSCLRPIFAWNVLKMGSGGLNGELRDNPNHYIESILHYHLNTGQRTRTSGPNQQHYTFNTSSTSPTHPSSSSSNPSNLSSNPTTSTDSDVDMVCYLCSANFNILKRKVS